MTNTFEREVYKVMEQASNNPSNLNRYYEAVLSLVSKTVLECLGEERTCCPYDPVEEGYNACLSTIKTNLQKKGVV